jgi:hypothetical protein
MRLSIFKHLDHAHRNQRHLWLADLEAMAVAADLFGYDTFWVGFQAESGTNQEVLQALWRLSAVTSRIWLGGIIVVRSQQAFEQLHHEIALLTTVTGGRIRIGLDLRPNTLCQQASSDENYRSYQAMIESLEHILTPSRFVTPPRAVTTQGSIAIIPDAALAKYAGCMGTALLVIAHEMIESYELIASYRQAAEGHASMILSYHQIRFGDEVGTIEQAAASVLVHQLATGADEILCDVTLAGSRQSEMTHAIEQLGRKLLPQSASVIPERVAAVATAHAELEQMLTYAVSSRRKPRRLPWLS